MLIGVAVGLVVNTKWATRLNQPAVIILRLLGAIAPPLILVAVVRALITANVRGRLAGKLFFLLILNTTVAILIGLFVANIVRPGKHGALPPGELHVTTGDPVSQFLDNIPGSVLGPLVSNNVIGVIIIAVAIGIAARKLEPSRTAAVLSATDTAFELIIIILHWIIALVPLAVFGKVVFVVGTQGFAPFKALAWFIAAVLLGLALQATYYLLRVKFSREWHFGAAISKFEVRSDDDATIFPGDCVGLFADWLLKLMQTKLAAFDLRECVRTNERQQTENRKQPCSFH